MIRTLHPADRPDMRHSPDIVDQENGTQPEVGLRFETADAEVVQRLTSIAGCGGIRRMLANSAAAATSSPTTPTAEAA